MSIAATLLKSVKMKNFLITILFLTVLRASFGEIYKPSNNHGIVKSKTEDNLQASTETPAYFPCPDPAEFSPCVCTADAGTYSMDVDCSAIASDIELVHAFSAKMSFYQYRNLTIQGVNTDDFKSLDLDTFGSSHFENVLISDTSLKFIGDGTFAASEEHVISMNLINNVISTYPFESLANMMYLENLDLSGNELVTVENLESASLKYLDLSRNTNIDLRDTLLRSTPELIEIKLNGCNIPSLPPRMFNNLNNLESIELVGNALQELEEESLYKDTGKWKKIVLDENPISTVRQNFLSGLDSDATISMVNTNLIELEEDTWKDYVKDVKDEAIDMTGNPLRCGCDIEWMYSDFTTYYTKLTTTTACSDGTTVYDIESDAFDFHCVS